MSHNCRCSQATQNYILLTLSKFFIKYLLDENFYPTFLSHNFITPPSLKQLLLKYSENQKRGSSLCKVSGYKTAIYYSWYLWAFRNQRLGTFTVWEGNNGLNLMSQYRPCIPGKYQWVFTVFHHFEVRLWKCYNVTINGSHLVSFTKLTQRWCNVVIPTSRRRCEFDIAVTTLYRRCYCNSRDMMWGEFTIQRWGNISTTLWIWRHSIDVGKTLWIWRCNFNVVATLSTEHL